MADDPNLGGDVPGKPRPPAGTSRVHDFAQKPLPEVAPSKALQWFLLGALVITGAAYVVGEWTELTKHPAQLNPKLQRLMQSQSDYRAHTKLGDQAFAIKHYDLAVSEYRLALQCQTNAAGFESLGKALLKQGNPEEAFAQFREASNLDPALTSVPSAWGLALADEGKPEEAARILQDGLQRNPDSGLLHYNLATTLLQKRTDAEGRRRIAAAAGQTAEVAAAETEVKGLAEDALSHLTKASRGKFDSPAFWSAFGQLLHQLGQNAEAETYLLRAVSEDGSMGTAQFELATVENQLGEYAEAIDHYRLVLTLTPDDPATLNNLALLYATATNAEVRTSKMAVQLATRACDATNNQNARYMDTLARSYAADSDFFQAITWEEKALHRARQLNDQDLARELEARDTLFLDHKTQ